MAEANSRAQGKTVEIPDSVRVRCPKIKGLLREIPKCMECEHHRSFNEQMFNPRLSVAQRFVISCAFPTDRQLFEVEE